MTRTPIALCALILTLVATTTAFASSVVKIRVDDTIQPISAEYIDRAIEHARQTNADAVLDRAAHARRAGRLHPRHHPEDSRLAGAGDRLRRAQRSQRSLRGILHSGVGRHRGHGARAPTPARRIRSSLGGEKMDDVMKAKMENDSAAFMRSFVGPRGRNVQLAESAVRESKSWTDQEALQQHLIDIVARDQDDLFHQLEGRTIKRFDGKQVKLHLVGDTVDEMPMTLRQRILDFLLDPNIAFLVLAVGALALYAEFNHPGAIVPGVVGVVFILLALFALNLLPTRYASFTLIIAAFVLFMLEAKFATHGILGIGGIALPDAGRAAAGRRTDSADARESVDSAGRERAAWRDHRFSHDDCPPCAT